MTESYWQLKNRNIRKSRQDIQIPSKVDIAIIGAGIVGLAVAYHLKRLGCGNVVILEKEYVGYGASGRNAGFLLSGMAESYNRLAIGMGRENAKWVTAATIENHDLIADAIEKLNIKCDYNRSGSYHLAVSGVEAGELEESANMLNHDGFPGNYYNRNEVCDYLGFGNYEGAFFNPIDGNLDPFAFVNGLSTGLDVIEGFCVTELNRKNGGVELKAGNKTIDAEMAVLATNGYTSLVDPYFKDLVFAVRGQMLAAKYQGKCALGNKTFYANFGYDYFRQDPENVIVMGGLRNRFIESEIGFDDSTSHELQRGLEDYIKENIGVQKPDILARWSGVMGNTIDGLPLVGPLPHNSAVIAAVGYNGHGFGLGMVVARDVANAIVKGETSDILKRFSIKRFNR